MSDVKLAYVDSVSMTVTNLNGLASSATAGWKSDAIDNTATKYLDFIFTVTVDMANTAPANDKSLYVYVYASTDGTNYTDSLSAGQGTYTKKALSNMPCIGVLNYNAADEIVISSPMSVALAFGGIIPVKFGLVIINFTGAAIAASGASVIYVPVYKTVA